MKDHPHLDALRAKHRELDERIQAEERRPGGDETEIARMKREKLKLKEEIAQFEAEDA